MHGNCLKTAGKEAQSRFKPPIKKGVFLREKPILSSQRWWLKVKRHLSERGSHHKTRRLEKGMNSGEGECKNEIGKSASKIEDQLINDGK